MRRHYAAAPVVEFLQGRFSECYCSKMSFRCEECLYALALPVHVRPSTSRGYGQLNEAPSTHTRLQERRVVFGIRDHESATSPAKMAGRHDSPSRHYTTADLHMTLPGVSHENATKQKETSAHRIFIQKICSCCPILVTDTGPVFKKAHMKKKIFFIYIKIFHLYIDKKIVLNYYPS